jgi:hypothetical protein
MEDYVKYALFSNEDKKALEYYRNHKDELSNTNQAEFLKNLISLKMQPYSPHEVEEMGERCLFPKRIMEREECNFEH